MLRILEEMAKDNNIPNVNTMIDIAKLVVDKNYDYSIIDIDSKKKEKKNYKIIIDKETGEELIYIPGLKIN